MKFASQATAEWRVLACAAMVGAGVGMSLGAAYMAGGMAQAATDHSRAMRIAEAAAGGFSDSSLQRDIAAMGPAAQRLARAHDPLAGDDAERDRQAALLSTDLGSRPAGSALNASRDLDCLTQAVYFEARGETPRGQAAVAQVVMNRVKNPNFPKTVCGVVFQGAARHGCQFSFACDGSMRQARETSAWDRARKIAARALSGAVLADIGSATHFHTTGVSPEWGPQMLRVAQVGLHVFYRFNPHAAPRPAVDGERAVFASLPTPNEPTSFRLAAALVEKTADVKPATPPAAPAVAASANAAAAPASAQVAATAVEPKPMPKLIDVPPVGLSKAADSTPAPTKPAVNAS